MRFKGFEGVWTEKRLGELLEFKNGINAPKEQYGKGVKFINVLDILNNDFITYECIIGEVDVDSDTIDKNSVTYGDILFQRSSETREEVGAANVYLDRERAAVFGGFVIRGRKIGDYEPTFLNKLLKTNAARQSITSKSGGSTRYNVGQETLSSTTLSFPSLSEQRKIASFLSTIDERIATQIKIIEGLNLFKAMVSKTLVEDCIGQEYKVSGIADLGRGRVISNAEISKQQNPQYPVYSSQTSNNGIMGYLDSYDFDGEYVTWTTDGAKAGTVFYRNGRFNCTNVCGTLKPNSEVNAYFFAQALQSQAKKYVSINLANPKLMNNVMGSIKVKLPEIGVQNRVSLLLQTIDSKIDIEERILLFYKSEKDFLLKQMFI